MSEETIDHLFEKQVATNNEPLPDMVTCDVCGKTFYFRDCEKIWGHHDGWELPGYYQYLCPHCKDGGCLNEPSFSKRQWRKHVKWETKQWKAHIKCEKN